MEWVIWTIGAILLVGLIIGIYRGAVRIAVSIATAILTVVITFFITPYVADIVEEKTPLDDSIKNYVVSSMADAAKSLLPVEEGTGLTKERVRKVLKAAGVTNKDLKEHGMTIEDIVNGDVKKEELTKLGISSKILDGQKDAEEKAVEELMEKEDIPRDTQMQAIETSEFPEIFKKLLKQNNSEETYAQLGAETFAQYVGTYLAKLIIHIGVFLAVFLLVTIIVRALVFALNIVNDIPVFGLMNRLAGGAAGMLCSLLVIWFLFIVVTLFYTTNVGKEIYDTIQGNVFTRIIYENNPLLKISMKF